MTVISSVQNKKGLYIDDTIYNKKEIASWSKREIIDNDGKSIERATKGDEFDYISCDNCGHEMVHMKHQVKCRKCKKNFSLSKLEGFM